jgi:hypothetical protein
MVQQYINNIPQADDIVAQSQPQLLNNCQSLDQEMDVDHYSMANSDANKRGKHAAARFTIQGADPTTLATEMAIYSKTVTGNTDLWVRPISNGTPFQLTSGSSGGSGFQAYGTFNNNGASAVFLSKSSNDSSDTYSAGLYTITFSPALSSANYGCVQSQSWNGSQSTGAVVLGVYSNFSQTTNQIKLLFYQSLTDGYFFAALSPTIYKTFGIVGV